MAAAFRHALTNAKVRGEIASSADVDALSRYLVGMAHGLMVMAKSGASREMLTEMVSTSAAALRPTISVAA